LRGARAARRIDALDTRLSMAMTAAHEATLITCPVCTTRVSPKTIADGPAVVLEPADSRWWTVSLPAVRGAYTQGSSPSASRKNLASLLHDFEGLRRDGLIAPNGPEDGTTPKTKSQAEGRRRYVEILVAVQRARICGSWSMAEVADDLASVWARLTPTAQEEIRRLTERVMGRAPKGGG
jgi:predicted RNase H-like HicB family nuclease